MQAVVLEEHGSPDILQVSKIPDLEPGREEVRVKVAASAVNRADAMQRQGNYPHPKPPDMKFPA